MRILVITRKPDSASFEQRVANYLPVLKERGVEVVCKTLPHSPAGQWILLGKARQYDAVWWHRHLLTAWLRPRLWQSAARVIFEFDDPLAFSWQDKGRPSYARGKRFAGMLRSCNLGVAASDYLRSLAIPYCPNVQVLPMAVTLPELPDRPRPQRDVIELLWLGQRATQGFLVAIQPVLEQLAKLRKDIRLRLVAHERMSFGALPVDFRQWSHEEQETALRECDLGICPMPDTPWTRGKCPYKVLQYMAYRMPWVGSAVGENLVTAGDPAKGQSTGLCATDNESWLAALQRLLDNPGQRYELGQRGRAYVEQHHNRDTLVNQLVTLLQQVVAGPPRK